MSRSKKAGQLETGKRQQDEAHRARRRRGLTRTIAVLVAIVIVADLVVGSLLLRTVFVGGSPAGPKRAVIVDQLSLTQPNPDFAASATSLLRRAGYVVDYFPGEEVTVDFYRDLPTHDYDLIILRVHSAITKEIDAATGEETMEEYVGLFTGEPYDETKYEEEQMGRLGKAGYYEGAPPLFGIAPKFIEYSMRGGFNNALIVMMGCDGLRSQRTAQAFLNKGARAFVSWDKPVSGSHTDTASLRLLEKLVVTGLPVGEAVAQTAAEVGPDPTYGAELRIYPPQD